MTVNNSIKRQVVIESIQFIKYLKENHSSIFTQEKMPWSSSAYRDLKSMLGNKFRHRAIFKGLYYIVTRNTKHIAYTLLNTNCYNLATGEYETISNKSKKHALLNLHKLLNKKDKERKFKALLGDRFEEFKSKAEKAYEAKCNLKNYLKQIEQGK